MTAEIDRLKEDLVKAQKSLDHATPGVWKSFSCSHVLLLTFLTATDLLISNDSILVPMYTLAYCILDMHL